MVGEVLGRRDYPCLLETPDGGDPHPGYQLGVLPEGTVADGGAMSGIYDWGEVRVDAGPQELASHSGRDAARFVGVFAPSDRRGGGLRRDPGRRGDVSSLLVHGDEEGYFRLRSHGELLEPAHEGLRLPLALHVVGEEDHTPDVPLPDHLLDVVVWLRPAHADDEHLPHHLLHAHAGHRGPPFIRFSPLLMVGCLIPRTFRRCVFSNAGASRQDEDKGHERERSVRRPASQTIQLSGSGSAFDHGAGSLALRAGKFSVML